MTPEEQEAVMTGEKASVLIIAENSDGAAEAATRLKEAGCQVHTADSVEAGLFAAESQPFDMLIFFRKEESLGETEVIEAASARNSEVEIAQIEPGDSAKIDAALEASLKQLRTRLEIRQATGRFHDLLDAVFDGVLIIDPATETITAVNAAAARALGYTREELRGMRVWEFIPDDRRNHLSRILRRVLKVGKVADEALVLQAKDRGPLCCQCNATLTGKPLEKLIQIVFQDTREKRRLIQHLAEATQATSVRSVISQTVHEINNPLAAILGYSQLSLTTTSRKKLDGYLHTIHQQAGRCQAIVEKLSSFARGPRSHRKDTDLNELVEEVTSLFSCELRLRNIEIKLSVHPSPMPVRVDPIQIQQVLVNLINNTAEAMAATENRELSICTECADQRAVVTVSGAGPGASGRPPSTISDHSFSSKSHGAGPELDTSLSIVRDNEGEIEVVSSHNEGKTFRIRFPLARRAVA